MKFCPRLLIFELFDCTLGIFRGYNFSIFKILQPACMFSYGVPPWDQLTQANSVLNADQKLSKNHDDLMLPDRDIATQISKKG